MTEPRDLPAAPVLQSPQVALLLPDVRAGGAERVNINLANELVARGYRVDLVLVRNMGGLLPLLDPRVRVVDLRVKRMRHVMRPLAQYLRRSRPESLLACMWPLTVIAVAARVVSGSDTRVIVAEHTTWSAAERSYDPRHRFFLQSTMRVAFPLASGVVAVSRGAADDLAAVSQFPRDKVTAIYNPIVGGVKTTSGGTIPPCLEWAKEDFPRILAVGTLKRIKDYDNLIRAFAALRKVMRAKLLILGEGEQRVPLERLISELGLGRDVTLLGFVENTEAYYRLAHLHVLSSTGEGLPTVIVEALEHGVPVVSTDCPSGPREILDGGRYGALVPVSDPAALAEAMRVALVSTHDTEALKDRAAEFSVSKATDAYLDLLLPGWRGGADVAGPRGR